AAPAAADTQPPTAPSLLTASATSSSQIHLGWAASADNVGVTGYLIERCAGVSCSSFAPVATASGTTYTDGGLGAATSYSYRVRPPDAANTLSGYSNPAVATTPAAAGGAPLTYVQGNFAAPQTAQASVAATFGHAQT